MSSREVVLDPRDYQDLVDEARVRVGRRCPEWTDHNVSDPGMTLIDQFAWMTDVLLYRVNRIPERLHWELLELLDVRAQPPASAHTLLRFRLAKPPQQPLVIPAGTEVATKPDTEHPAVVFAVTADATVPVIGLAGVALERTDTLTSIAVLDGVARPLGSDREAFSVLPQPGDALYLGFATSPERLVLQVHVKTTEARGTGIDPDLPPVVWELPRADGTWSTAVEVLSDRTGGFNYPVGTTEVQVPQHCVETVVGGRRMYWLRCRIAYPQARGDRYASPPLIEEISVEAIGVLAHARHAMVVVDELLGVSDGTPGQRFKLLHAPALRLQPGEHLAVSDREQRHPSRWESVDSFADSRPNDHVFRFEPAIADEQADGGVTAEIQFGPAIRVARGWRQHGAVPPKGARLVMTGYRHGGGSLGNVERGRLTVLRKPIRGVASVTNPRPARGGIDIEPLDAARLRAAEELTTRHRAVTRTDFELLAHRASPHVARARCVAPAPGEAVVVQILPKVADPREPIHLQDLVAAEELRAEVAERLLEACLIGTSVHVTPVVLRVVTVAVEVEVGPAVAAADVEDRVCRALHRYLNPLVGGDIEAAIGIHATHGDGWDWGRTLSRGELNPLVRGVAGVEAITMLRVYETDPLTGIPIEPHLERPLELEPGELIASGPHVAHAVPRRWA
jgi:predicted phage baseplate assembly protein